MRASVGRDQASGGIRRHASSTRSMAARTSCRISERGRAAAVSMSASRSRRRRDTERRPRPYRCLQHPGLAVGVAGPVRQHVAPAPAGQQGRGAAIVVGQSACRRPHAPVGCGGCAHELCEISGGNLHAIMIAPGTPRGSLAWLMPPAGDLVLGGTDRCLEKSSSASSGSPRTPTVYRQFSAGMYLRYTCGEVVCRACTR
jgi:hypothetical protein